jgi:hypothetical protein
MKRRTVLAAISVTLAGLAASSATLAQGTKSIIGSWIPVSAVVTDPSGKKNNAFGDAPRGMLVFMPDGRYTLTIMEGTLPKFASNNRAKGTPDENRAVVAGSIAHIGKYSVDEKEKTLTFHVESSTYPNWEGQSQKRVFSVSKDELTYKVATASLGGSAELVWKRVK